MRSWKKTTKDTSTRVGFRTIVHKTFERADGSIVTADTYNPVGASAVCVIPITPDRNVVIARQFRCGPERILDELPGGGLEKDDTPEQAARRELLEETGYEASEFEYLGQYYRDAWSNAVFHGYIAHNCRPSGQGQALDDFEVIEVHEVSIPTLVQNALNGDMSDAMTVLLARDRLESLADTHTQ